MFKKQKMMQVPYDISILTDILFALPYDLTIKHLTTYK